MKVSWVSFSILGVVFLAMASSDGSTQGAPGPRTYYIDFDKGSDSAAGTSQNAAWRHAPGDPLASGMPAKVALMPGDTVLFRAGVVYRGSIPINASGAPGQPITYSGQGWGTGRAIFSGRDAVSAPPRPCSSSPLCAKLPNADRLVVIDLPAPVSSFSQIVIDGQIVRLAQSPKLADPFLFDDAASYVEAKLGELSPMADGKTWQLQNSFIKKSLGDDAAGDLLVLILGYPNVITSGPATAYDQNTGTVLFQPLKFRRDEKAPVIFALANHPRLISQPYEYATIERGTKIIVQAPLNVAKLEVSRRAWAFTSVGQKNIAIKGFEIEGFTDGPQGGGGAALAVRNASNILFDGNDVHDLYNWAGGGAVSGEPVTGLVVTNNSFRDLPHGSGIRIGKAIDSRIVGNKFDKIGRTGVMVMNSQRVLVDHNNLRRLYGSHGNGMSIYLDNRDVVVSNNLVSDSTRAVTFHGARRPDAPPNNIVFRANLFKGNNPGGVALQSWGGNTNGVTIERNVLLVDNSVQALRLSGRDRNVVVRQNVIDGYQGYPMPLSSDTVIEGNIFVSGSRGSTSGNDVEPGYRKAADTLFSDAGSPDPKICSFLLRGSQPGTGIGPNDACKTP
jgi:hypothetical protein